MRGAAARPAACAAVLGLVAGSVLVSAGTPAASAATAAVPTVEPQVFVHHPAGANKPDDITRLGDLIYVTYQNNAGKDGTPAGSHSTILAFDRGGRTVAGYTIPGRCDGLTADPAHDRLLATANEDLNSSMYVIKPGTPQPTHYTYSPDPAQTGSDGTNGGTDSISVTPSGTIYVAHSNPESKLPAPNNAAAVYSVTLSGTTAQLKPVFGVNDVARTVGKPGGAATPLALTDPDSNTFLPDLNGGTLIQDSQGDSKLVMASNLGAGRPTLAQLPLTNATPAAGGPATTPQVDDIAQVTGPGTLYVVDQGPSARVYSIDTRSVPPGTLFVSQPKPGDGDLPNSPSLGVLDPATGVVTHIPTPVTSPKGLLFVPAAQHAEKASAVTATGDVTTLAKKHPLRSIAAAGAVAVVLIVVAFLVGRRRGRKA